MPKICFTKSLYPSFEIENNSILMGALLTQSMPVASSCNGKGVCSKCKIRIIEGHNNLSPETPVEIDLKQKNNIPKEFRISCQTQVRGDITIDADYW